MTDSKCKWDILFKRETMLRKFNSKIINKLFEIIEEDST